MTDQTARVTTALRSASEELEANYPHLVFLLVTLESYVVRDIPGISERMDWGEQASNSDIRREIRILFRQAMWKTSGLLLARAQYSHAVEALHKHRFAPGFARADRKALRLGPLPYRKALASQFADALPKADAEMCARNREIQALGAEWFRAEREAGRDPHSVTSRGALPVR